MKPTFLATVTGGLLAASLGAQAGQSTRPPDPLDPLDPNAPVPALAYDSALRAYARSSADASATPDKTWRRANDTVAGNAGHAGAASAEAAPASPPTAPAPAHAHHHPGPAKQ
jgi:hypothetical protein